MIDNNSVVTLAYRVSDTLGETIAKSQADAPESFLIGTDGLLPKIQQSLLGQTAGYSTKLQIEPEDAFGDYDAELLRLEERKHFPEKLEPGMQFEGLPAGCKPHDDNRFYTVTDVTDEAVVLDGNHPLAGIAVRFELTVIAVRAATPDELDSGQVEGSADSALRVLEKPHTPDQNLH